MSQAQNVEKKIIVNTNTTQSVTYNNICSHVAHALPQEISYRISFLLGNLTTA